MKNLIYKLRLWLATKLMPTNFIHSNTAYIKDKNTARVEIKCFGGGGSGGMDAGPGDGYGSGCGIIQEIYKD